MESYPGITDHTLESQIIPPNDKSYPEMTKHTRHGMTDHTPNGRSNPATEDRTPQ